MTPSRASTAPARCRAAVLLSSALLLAGLPLDAAKSGTTSISATATVVEAVKVLEVLGTPVSLGAVLAALNAPAGPQTGSALIRLVVEAPVGLAGSARAFSLAGLALSSDGRAAVIDAGSGVLHSGLAAAVSLAGANGAQQPASLIVAFN